MNPGGGTRASANQKKIRSFISINYSASCVQSRDRTWTQHYKAVWKVFSMWIISSYIFISNILRIGSDWNYFSACYILHVNPLRFDLTSNCELFEIMWTFLGIASLTYVYKKCEVFVFVAHKELVIALVLLLTLGTVMLTFHRYRAAKTPQILQLPLEILSVLPFINKIIHKSEISQRHNAAETNKKVRHDAVYESDYTYSPGLWTVCSFYILQ